MGSARGESFRVLAVRFERLLPGSSERVWEYLTDCRKLTAWFGDDGTIEPRVGGAIRFMQGHIRGVVTQWKPHRRLAYTWNVFSPGEADSPYPESYLTFDLEPQDSQIRLTLTHLPILERFEQQNMMGWHTFLDILDATARGEPVEARKGYMQRNAALYGVDLGNLHR
jgi:uncharacterized protein YndB with AHSA1/START domain